MRVRTREQHRLRCVRWRRDRLVEAVGVTNRMVSVCRFSFSTATSSYDSRSVQGWPTFYRAGLRRASFLTPFVRDSRGPGQTSPLGIRIAAHSIENGDHNKTQCARNRSCHRPIRGVTRRIRAFHENEWKHNKDTRNCTDRQRNDQQ